MNESTIKVIGTIVGLIADVLITTWIIWILYNNIIVEVFSTPTLTYLQTFGIKLFIHLLMSNKSSNQLCNCKK